MTVVAVTTLLEAGIVDVKSTVLLTVLCGGVIVTKVVEGPDELVELQMVIVAAVGHDSGVTV